jgi:CRP-like cAMP-binding protein
MEGAMMARSMVDRQRAAEEIAERLAGQTQAPQWRDAEPLRRVADAFHRSVAADGEVAEAVNAARADGYSWAAIASMLGVSKQTAQVRYGGAGTR